MYKVGDKVRVTDPFYKGLYNTTREVVKVDDMYIYIEDGTSSPYPMKEREIELVKEPEFKVGDKVTQINENKFSNGERVATVEKVETSPPFGPRVWLKETFTWIEADQLNIVREEKEKMEKEILMPLYVGENSALMFRGEEFTQSQLSVYYTSRDILQFLLDGELEVVNKETPNPRVVRAAEGARNWIQSIVIIRAMTGCGLKEAKEFYDNHVTLYPE